jgi:hypothetical protein
MDAMKFFATGLLGITLTMAIYTIYENLKSHYFYANGFIILIIFITWILIFYIIYNTFKKS